MRLDKYIAGCGAASRSEVKKLVRIGRVTVNGAVAAKCDMKINDGDAVCLDGAPLLYREFVYLMLNKPAGYVSATEDKRYPVVTDLLDDKYRHFHVFPVGRLDIDTGGLLLLTNDGKFAHEIISPKKEIYKTYHARLDKPAEVADITVFAAGMDLGDFIAKPAELVIGSNPYEITVRVCEGKFHQVKRMCEKVGKTVVALKRTAIGALVLPPDLPVGAFRELTDEEKRLIKQKYSKE